MPVAYLRLSDLSERERLAALEWMGKTLVYGSTGFGDVAASGKGVLSWDQALRRQEPWKSADPTGPIALTIDQQRWQEGLRTLVGELGYGFGLETTNNQGFYAIRLEPLPDSPNPPILLIRGTEPTAKDLSLIHI